MGWLQVLNVSTVIWEAIFVISLQFLDMPPYLSHSPNYWQLFPWDF